LEQKLESNKQAFASEFVQRSRFVSTYPTSMSSEQFVDALYANAGVTLQRLTARQPSTSFPFQQRRMMSARARHCGE